MTTRGVKFVSAFDYRSDFGPQVAQTAVADDPARVSFTGEEVAGLIAQVRAETLAEAETRQAAADTARLAAVTAELRAALGDIVQVMGLIENVQYRDETEQRLRGLIDAAAGRIARGQGDLFAAGQTIPERQP